MIEWNGIKIVETDCMLPIDRVKPYARNAKRHPQEQIDEIKASIKRFGMDDPIGHLGQGKPDCRGSRAAGSVQAARHPDSAVHPP